ncbi:dTDP-4-dehydrorhamnose reductase [Roseovarius sp. MMSF_3281]|uniref:dTDP-4-dehydrorhamnose reductase n=1 Tax=Roseovarius sp. MMSF_3281 TaxID=3046694 RepID=UPI00273E8888|nr:dTDP-4-dehydrorhamnose reductase [Roseovarius sp. MMSF_3281]
MRILVFGTSGQVATELQDLADVMAVGRDVADLGKPETCRAAIVERQPDVVINAAAYTAVDKAEEEEDLANLVNGEAPGVMAQTCAELGIPFVHISTDYVFDGSGVAAWRPDDDVGPLGVYGRSKLLGEKKIAEAGGTWAVLRTSWVFSPHGANFVKTMLRLGKERDKLTIVADQIGGPTPARKIAEACLQMAKSLKEKSNLGGIYHFSGAPDVSWADFAREIFAQAGLEVEVEDIPTSAFPTAAKRPANSRMDCSATEAAFGINRPDWREELPRILG